MLIVNTMCKLLTAIFVGIYGQKRNIFTKETTQHLSSFLIRIASPYYILYSVMNGGNTVAKETVLTTLAVGVMIYVVSVTVAFIVVKLLRFPKEENGIYQVMLIFANCGFMGIPVCQSFFGDKCVFLVSIMNLPYNLLFFTYGVYLMSKGKNKNGGSSSGFSLSNVINPGTVCSIVALIIYFTGVQAPTFLSDSLGFVGAVLTPMSMVCIGCNIAQYSLKTIFGEKTLYPIVLVRLVLYPILIHALFSVIFHDPLLFNLATISVGMPVGSMVVMGAEEYGGNVRLASGGVALTTLLSILTIPVMALFLGV